MTIFIYGLFDPRSTEIRYVGKRHRAQLAAALKSRWDKRNTLKEK